MSICRRYIKSIKKCIPASRIITNMLDQIPVKCSTCEQTSLTRGNFNDHINKTCPNINIPCSASNIKCPWIGLRHEYETHLSTCKYEALRLVLTQLISDNEQLREVNQKLNSQHKKMNIHMQQVLAENQEFNLENQKLNLEIRKLNLDNKKLHIEKEQIYFQNQQLNDEIQEVRQENQWLILKQQQLTQMEQQIIRFNQLRNKTLSIQFMSILTSIQPIQTSFIPIVEEQKTNRSSSPIFLKKQKLEPIQNENDQSSFPIDRPRIRIINGSHDNRKQSSSGKKIYKSNNQIDENSMIKPIRMSTRKNSIKTEIIADMNPSFETKPIILSSNEISKQWLTHTVFYRCHACSHEEFFVVLSRECINLHISSKHGNMEENFKQRLSNFLNNKGHSLKIFQHYLKWQQPWSEKQIEQIFKLSNK
ncbi:unnamed protein product [Rotaria sp. Silwood1]|nr:unnamed protein product [Rotaria sp. Silwood1]CAF4994558.1 unnamed protein product [Rotaria sp. Silwood1]